MMKQEKILRFALFAILLVLLSCKNDDENKDYPGVKKVSIYGDWENYENNDNGDVSSVDKSCRSTISFYENGEFLLNLREEKKTPPFCVSEIKKGTILLYFL